MVSKVGKGNLSAFRLIRNYELFYVNSMNSLIFLAFNLALKLFQASSAIILRHLS